MSDVVRYFIHEKYPVLQTTQCVLEQMAHVPGVIAPIVALPDLHYKQSYHTPTGVVVLTKDVIIPKFLNANCGMTFIVSPFFSHELSDERINLIFEYLRRNISVATKTSPVITKEDFTDIMRRGAAWSIERFKLNQTDCKNFENYGSLTKDDSRSIKEIISSVPEFCQKVALYSLGVLGYGNHFIEMQTVDAIFNQAVAEKFGLSPGQICFMIHSDSRAFGQAISDYYSRKAKKLFGIQNMYKNIHYRIFTNEHIPPSLKGSLEGMNRRLNQIKTAVYRKGKRLQTDKNFNFQTIDAKSDEGVVYETATACAINFGYANRAYLSSVIRDALQGAFGVSDCKILILHDGNHDALQREIIDKNTVLAHRNGASRAWPGHYYPQDHLFAQTGQPVLLPSSLGNPSYLCAAAKGCAQAYYSACHGTGRIIDRAEARELFTTQEVLKQIEMRKVKVFDYGGGFTAEESPQAFKNADRVLEVMKKFDMAQPVVKLSPLAALKGWR